MLLILLYAQLCTISSLNYLQKINENNRVIRLAHNHTNHRDTRHLRSNDPLSNLKSWKSLYQFNGLKNKEIAYLVISSWVGNGRFYRSRIVSAARTWMRLTANAFVIVEDTLDSRMAFRNCPMQIHNNHNLTSFHCRNEPVFILTRTCASSPGPPICCKLDELINFLFLSDIYPNIKFVLISDDDSYWRVDRVMEWLSYINKANISHIPLIGNSDKYYSYEENKDKKCSEIVTYGWYGQTVLNRAALEKYKHASFGLMKTCEAWNSAQDVNFGILAWTLEFCHVNRQRRME